MKEQILVIGGSSPWDENRLRETVDMLDLAPVQTEEAYVRNISECENIEQLSSLVENIAYFGYNLCGSRGYCYDAHKIAEVIRDRDPEFILVTRTGGLRAKYIELYLKEKAQEVPNESY